LGIVRLLLLLAFAGAVHAAQPPDAVLPDGGRYYGPLVEGKAHGRGRAEWDDERTYRGEFSQGRFHGEGRAELPSREVFEGEFRNGEFTGSGTYNHPNGARYRGEFLNWRMHGRGRMVRPDGSIYEGEWRHGKPDDPAARHQAALNIELALHHHRPLLDAALASLEPGRPGRIDMYLLAVAGDGTQEVFRREAEFVREQLGRDFGTRGRTVALINSRNTVDAAPMATLTSIREALKAIAARMNRDEDVLFLFLTSHGTREHELSLQQRNLGLRALQPKELAGLLKESGIRWKVVVLSACYAGGFIDALKDERTLVIAAARHDRQSFGCADDSDLTYFGRAFFKEALPGSKSFAEAFDKAQALIAEREKKEQPREEPSLPQIHSPRPITDHLQRWWAQRTTR